MKGVSTEMPRALRARAAEITPRARIDRLKEAMLDEERFMSVEQARIVTESYREHADEPRVLQRAHALARSLRQIGIRIDPEELIVGNRTPGVRGGVVFPEAGIAWVAGELDTLSSRPQDPFSVRPEDARVLPGGTGPVLVREHAGGRSRPAPRTPRSRRSRR